MNLFQLATRGINLDELPEATAEVEPYGWARQPGAKLEIPPDLNAAFDAAADEYGVDADVLRAMAYAESRFRPDVISGQIKSRTGATGLMQFMPGTAERFGINPVDPVESIFGAAAYMRANLEKFDGDYDKAVAAYNWGENRQAYGSDDWKDRLPAETKGYLNTVFGAADELKLRAPAPPERDPSVPLPDGVKPSQAGAGRGVANPEIGVNNAQAIAALRRDEAAPLDEATRGVKTGITGLKQMWESNAVLKDAKLAANMQQRLDAFDRIDAGATDVPRAIGLAYQQGGPAERQRLREMAQKELGQRREFLNASLSTIKQYQADMERTKGRVTDFTDIEGVKDFTNWLAFNGGSGMASMAPLIVAAVATGPLAPVAAGAVGFGMATGEINSDRIDFARKKGLDNKGVADYVADKAGSTVGAAIPFAALDVVAGPVGSVLSAGAKGGIKELQRMGARQAAKEVAKDTAEEFVTGGAQEAIKLATGYGLGETSELLTAENAKKLLNAAAAEGAGGLTGGAARVGGTAALQARVPRVEDQPTTPQAPVVPAAATPRAADPAATAGPDVAAQILQAEGTQSAGAALAAELAALKARSAPDFTQRSATPQPQAGSAPVVGGLAAELQALRARSTPQETVDVPQGTPPQAQPAAQGAAPAAPVIARADAPVPTADIPAAPDASTTPQATGLTTGATANAATPATPTTSTPGAAPGGRVILQNRNRATPSSVAQMRSIAASPDYGRLGFSRDFANGAPVVAGGSIPAAQLGRQDTATASNGRRIPVQYAVVDAGAVLTSNRADGTTNTEYGNAEIAALRAIAGNGRIAGLQAAYEGGNAANYRQELAQDAALHGIDPAVIAPMAQPVLVRVMPDGEVTADIGDVSNTVGNLDLSAVEQANNDGARVSLDALQFSEDGAITDETVRQFVRAMPTAEQGRLINTNGQPTAQAVDRLNAAVFARAYGNDQLTNLYAQATDPEARLVMSALAQLAPKMARLDGAGAMDIRPVVAQAAEIAVNARRQGVPLARAAEQLDMAADPLVGRVLELFARNPRSNREAVERLSTLADMAYAEATKSDTDMFGDVPRLSREQVFDAALQDGRDERTGQETLEQPAGREPVRRDAGGQDPDASPAADAGSAQEGRAADAAVPGREQAGEVAEPLELSSYTPEEVNARQDAQAEADQAREREAARADHRARADADRDSFSLIGSDRPADVLEAQGQAPMFSRRAAQDVRNLVTLHNLSADNLLHADRLGGIPAPSIGITKVDAPFSGFGDITLIAPKGMIDPADGVPVYDRDAWTARFPALNFKKPKAKQADALYERMKPVRDLPAGDDGFLSQLWEAMRNASVTSPDKLKELFARYEAPRALYAQEVLGKTVRAPMRDVPLRKPYGADRQLLAHWKKHGAQLQAIERAARWDEARDTEDFRAFGEQVRQAIERTFPVEDGRVGLGDSLRNEFMNSAFNEAGSLRLAEYESLERYFDNAAKREVDRGAYRKALDRVVKADDAGYERWAEALVQPLFEAPTITLRGKEVPATLDNIVSAMTVGATAGVEKSLTYSPGKVAAVLGKRFKSLAEIQAARDQVTSETQEAEGKKATDAMLDEYRQHVAQFYTHTDWRGNVDTWAANDDAMEALAKAGKAGETATAVRMALGRAGFKAVDDRAVQLARQAIAALRNSATNYFEAKPQRAVQLREFAGAVVPRGIGADALAVLEKNGIAVEMHGKGEGAREKAILKLANRLDKERGDVLFSFAGQQVATADVADADVIVTFNGKEMASAPMPSNASGFDFEAMRRIVMGDAAGAPGRTPAVTAPGATTTQVADAIRRAYGNLLDRLQAKGLVTLVQTEDEAVEAAARARAAKTGQPVEQARASLSLAMRGDGVDVRRSAAGAVEGFYDPVSGKSFLVADGLTEATAPGTLMHEVGIHMAADDKLRPVFDRAAGLIKMGRGNPFINRVQARMRAAGETSAEEAAAYIVTEYETDRASAPPSVTKWVQDFIAAVRAWLFNKGVLLKADQLTVADIAAVARANARSLARGGEVAAQALAPAFSVDPPSGAKALAEFAKADELFALPKSDKETVEEITAEIAPEINVKVTRLPGETMYTLSHPDMGVARITERSANPYGASLYGYNLVDGEITDQITERPGENPEDVDPRTGDVWLDVSLLKPGNGGTKIYAIATNYAHNTGKIFIGDPAGLSTVALRRRLEQMLSSALKFGTTAHLAPHPDQVRGGDGVPPLRWVYGDDVGNVERMIAASVKALDNAMPSSKLIAYEPARGFYRTDTGASMPRGQLAGMVGQAITTRRAVAGADGSTGQAGWRTLARAALLRHAAAAAADSGGRPGAALESLGLQLPRLTSDGTTGPAGSDQERASRIFYSRGVANPAQTSLFTTPPWQLPDATHTDKLIYELQDGRIDLKRAQEAIAATGKQITEGFDARLAETLMPGRIARRTETFLELEARPLLESMARNGVSQEELSDYLLARHAPERNAQVAKVNPDMPDGGAGSNSQGVLMTTQAARDHIAGLTAGKRAALDLLARQVDAITADTRAILVREGLEKQSTVDAWAGAYQHYVPLFKDEAMDTMAHPIGAGVSVTGAASKRSTGSTGEVTNMLAHVMMQREAAITRAEKNRVAMALYGLALTNPNAQMWTTVRPSMPADQIADELRRMGVDPMEAEVGMQGIPTIRSIDPVSGKVVDRPNLMYHRLDNALTVKVNGEDRVILFNAKNERAVRLVRNLKNQDGVLAHVDLAGSFIGKATRYFAAINTQYNPAFGMVNVVRDVGGALVNLSDTALAGQQARVLSDAIPAMKGIARDLRGDAQRTPWSDLWQQFQDDGGRTGYRDLFIDPYKRAETVQSELDKLAKAGTLTPGAAAHAVLDLLDDFNTTLENGVRLAAYKAALDKGLSRAESARLARELTLDFNRKGRVGREIGPLFAFFNASVQGTARTLKALQGPAGKRILLGGLGLGVMQALMLAAAGFEDDEIPEFIKARAFIIPLPGKQYIAIPLQFGLNALPNTGRVATELLMSGGKEWGEKSFNALGELAGSFNPLGGGNIFTGAGALKTISPTVVDPIVDMATNTDFTGRPIAKESMPWDTRPGFAMARESTQRSATGQVYLGISKAINSVTGGNDFKQGLASPAPEEVRYVFTTLGGGVYRELEKSLNAAILTAQGETLKAREVPLGSRFAGEVDDQDLQRGRYFKNTARLEKLEAQLKGFSKEGRGEEARALVKDNPEVKLYELNNEVRAEITKLNKLAAENVRDKDAMGRIDAARTLYMRALNDKVRAMEREVDGSE